MRKIIGFRTLCVGLGIWVGTVVVSAQGEFKALPWSQSTAYNSYLMRDVHRQFASRQSAIQQAFTSPAGMQEYLEGCRERYKQRALFCKNLRRYYSETLEIVDLPYNLSIQNGYLQKNLSRSSPTPQ